LRLDDWRLTRDAAGYRAQVVAREFALSLHFAPRQPLLLQGESGVSRKGPLPGQASYYYSQPHLAVSGDITIGGERLEVSGEAWLDHEWSSEILAPSAAGWDWAGLQFPDGAALMAFRIRGRDGGVVWAGGSYRDAAGRRVDFAPKDIEFTPLRRWRSSRTGAEYPVAMRLRAGELTLELEPLMDDQELDSRATTGTVYWEGAVRVSRDGVQAGRGYMELTGYLDRPAL
jgi:predicted secreted hydrolase